MQGSLYLTWPSPGPASFYFLGLFVYSYALVSVPCFQIGLPQHDFIQS